MPENAPALRSEILRDGSTSASHGTPVMAAISANPQAVRLVLVAKETATLRGCPWLVIWIEGSHPLSVPEQNHLEEAFRLTRRLGGEVISAAGADIAGSLLRIAGERHVSQLIVGKPSSHRPSPVDRLIRAASEVDINVIQSAQPSEADSPVDRAPTGSGPSTPRGQYGWALLIPSLMAAACWFIAPVTGYLFVGMLFLLAVVLAALRLDRGPIVAMATLSMLTWNFFFIPPQFAFSVDKVEDVVMCSMFFLVVLSMFTSLLRHREMAERRHQQQTSALLHVTQSAALAVEPAKGLTAAVRTINSLLHAETALVVRETDGQLPHAVHEASTFQPEAEEWTVIDRCYQENQPAGRFTSLLPEAAATWFPLQTATTIMGVLGVSMRSESSMDFSTRQTIEAFALQLALVLEKQNYIKAIQQAEVAEASEKLRHTLLDSVSHELKTPLAALQSAADEMEASPGSADRFIPEFRGALRRLRRTVDNLLNMTRLQSGAARPVMDWCDVDELCDSACELVGDALQAHAFRQDIPIGLPMVKLDRALMEQALANLLLNAATHTPPGCEVTLQARLANGRLRIAVLDRGPGLPAGKTSTLFQKFARGEHAPSGGSGLGLAIARGFVHAHGGSADARQRDAGGAEFSLTLPVETLDESSDESFPTDSARH